MKWNQTVLAVGPDECGVNALDVGHDDTKVQETTHDLSQLLQARQGSRHDLPVDKKKHNKLNSMRRKTFLVITQ